jgi:hypothetical protein
LQIFVPFHARDHVEPVKAAGAIGRVVPGLEGEARQAEVGPGLVLGAAQGRHAREGHPNPFPACRCPVDHQDVADALAHQREGYAQPGLPGADDQHVQSRPALVQPRHHPLRAWMRRHFDLPPDAGFEGGQVGVGHAGRVSKSYAIGMHVASPNLQTASREAP